MKRFPTRGQSPRKAGPIETSIEILRSSQGAERRKASSTWVMGDLAKGQEPSQGLAKRRSRGPRCSWIASHRLSIAIQDH